MSTPRPLGTVITFYSYKGGAGRTLALANVAALLATWGRRVLCIDWDLEAPGLHHYFKDYLPADVLRSEPGLVELAEACARGETPDWRAHVRRMDLPGAPEALAILPAGRLDDTYVARMQQIDWEALYDRQRFGVTLEAWRDEWKETYDFILVDSRTGVSDIGGICTIQLPDQLVLCVTANEQSLQGAKDIAERAARQRQRLPFDRAGVPCVLVPTRFEVESERAKEWLERFATEFEPLYRQWIAATVTPRALLDLVKIPYIPVWSFGEGLPVLTEGTTDPESIGFAFETLAGLLMRGLSDTDLLLTRRDEYIGARPVDTALGAGPHVVVWDNGGDGAQRVAHLIAANLRKRRMDTWASDLLLPGDHLKRTIEAALTRSRACILVLGQYIGDTRNGAILREILDLAISAPGVRLIPVRLPALREEDLPAVLRPYHCLDWPRADSGFGADLGFGEETPDWQIPDWEITDERKRAIATIAEAARRAIVAARLQRVAARPSSRG